METLDDDVSRLRELFDISVSGLSITNEHDAARVLAAYPSSAHATDRFFDLLITTENTGLTVGSVRALENHFFLADVIDGSSRPIAETLCNIAACLPGVVQPNGERVPSGPIRPGQPECPRVPAFVKLLNNSDAWREAILIGRALSALGRFPCSNARTKAVAEAATRLKQRGYSFTIASGRVQIQGTEVEAIVAAIERNVAALGGLNALLNVLGLAGELYPYAYEQFLFGRSYAKGLGERAPTIPIGLLYNLAVKLPLQPPVASDPSGAWSAALALARDFVAALDLEPYTHFAFLGMDGPRLESGLRQVAHYASDCFLFRQWHFSFTPEFLAHFFGDTFDVNLKEKFGWTLADAIDLARCLNKLAVVTPTVIPIDALILAGMDRNTVMAMLPQFAHHECEVNQNYRSPFDATGPDIIFKPLILFRKQFLVIPTASTIGPALFEATFAATITVSSNQAISDLRGGGTERLTKHVFSKRGLHPTFENAKYDLGPVGAGECDFVFEDDQNVVFVECKAKALTRAAMTGAQGEALLDFAGGLFASQAQALRHERILRSAGSIEFVDGLDWIFVIEISCA